MILIGATTSHELALGQFVDDCPLCELNHFLDQLVDFGSLKGHNATKAKGSVGLVKV